jgi:hypothetical protein
MKKLFLLIGFLMIFSKITIAQYTTGYKPIVTVFDSLLMAKTGLSCNQLYNKVISDYYKLDNYQGDKNTDGAFIHSENKKVLVNGEVLNSYKSIKDLQRFKKIITYHVFEPDDPATIAVYGISGGKTGVIVIKAK